MNIEDYGFTPRRPEVIDSSMLKDFINCPSYFYLRHILGLRRKFLRGEGEAKFDWGTCWHHVMKAWTTNYDLTEALLELDEKYPEYITPFTDKKKRSKERMIHALFGYVDKFGKSDQRDYEILRSEQFFDVYDEDVDLRWCGRIDDIRRRRGNKNIVVWDYKTSSSMGSTYFDMHELGFQFPGYVWAGDHMFAGETVLEIKVDVMYMITASHEYFRRTFRYPPPRTDEWVRNVKWWLERLWILIDSALTDPSKWGLNWNYCTNYGKCDFFPVHSATPQGRSRLAILQDSYVVDYWDPREMGETDA